ncbi:ADP-heptose--LPS heptosyltransferase, partial [candidate division KSB1 bacterium]
TDEQFDTAIVPHRSFRSAFIVKAAKIPVRIGFDKSAGSYFFNRIVKYSSSSHEVERNFSLLQNLGWDGKVYAPVLYPGEAERRKAEIFLGESGVSPRQQLLAVAPGSVWFTKRWPIEYFADTVQKLCKNFNIKTILIGGEKDRRLGDYIVSVSDGEAVNAMGKLSLLESAEVIRRCRVTLTNDSAPLHLSVAVGTPVVALFGPTTPDFGFYPWGSGHTVLYKNVDCSPCGIHGSRKCPKKHFKCMRTIMPEQVVEAVRKYL